MSRTDPNPESHLQGEINALRMITITGFKLLLREAKSPAETYKVWVGAVSKSIETLEFEGGDTEANERLRETMAHFAASYFNELRR